MAQRMYGRGARRSRSLGGERHAPRTETPKDPESAPMLQIGRGVYPRTVHGNEWFDYVTELAGGNLHLDVQELGKMTCVYVDTTSINTLLADRYPKSYTTRRGIMDIQRGFVADFQTFVRNSLKARREHEAATIHQERVIREPSDPVLVTPPNRLADMWGTAAVRVRPHLAIVGSDALALDLSENEVLWREVDEIGTYLQHDEKLNLSLIHTKEDRGPFPPPHIRLVEAQRNIAEMAIRLPQEHGTPMPGELTLVAPRAWRESAMVCVGDIPGIAPLDAVAHPQDILV